MRIRFLLCIFFISGSSLFAQPAKIDSLENVLKNPVRDTNRVIALFTLADLLRGSDPDRCIKLADEAITLSNELSYGRGISGATGAKASALVNKGKADDAIRLYDQQIPIVLRYGYVRGYCILMVKKGYVYINSGRPSDAIPVLKQAVPECGKYKQYDALSDAYRGMGTAYTAVGDHEKAAGCFVEAIKAAEKGAAYTQVGYSYISLGNSQSSQKDYEGALISYRQGLVVLDSINSDYGRSGCYISIGNVFLFQKKLDSALSNYQKCLVIRERMNDPAAIAGVKENIATVLLEQDKPEQALIYFKEGLEVFEAQSNVEGIAGSLSNIGNAYLKMKKYPQAEENFLAALKHARRAGLNNWIQESFLGLSKLYYETGRYKEAAEYKDSLIAITDIIVGEQHAAQSKEIEAKFKNQQNEEQIAHLQEVGVQQLELATKQEQIIIAVSVGLALVFFLMLFAVRANAQRRKANVRLTEQNGIIAEKNKDITDSITYARRIQQSVLPDENILLANVAEAFVLYMPRDIVSGDFYWFRKEGSRLYIACADCTGHGVPGALVSVIGVNILEQVVGANKSISTGELLDQLHRMMYAALHKDSLSRGSNDGMDIGVLCIDDAAGTIEFSGASRSAFHYRGNQIEQIKGDRFSIGGVKDVESTQLFATHRLPLVKGDAFYLFTDGYADQFGGPLNKKFMSKQFMELIASNAAMDMTSQQSKIHQAFNTWKGNLPQVDDVLVIGIRI